jgi:methionyl aminopeptidase
MNPIQLGIWKRDKLDLTLPLYPPNLVIGYNQKLEQIYVNNDTCASERVNDMRKAAEAHRQVRRFIQPLLKPGIPIINICELLENKTRELLGDTVKSGIGFPTGLSLNDIAAHDSANPNDTRTLEYDDVCKIDFGTQINGNIIDSAFTVAFNPVYKPLLNSSKDGTWTGIKMAGVDVLISEVTEAIQEVMESYELIKDNKVYPIKAVTNLGGHNIEPYKIHGGKLVLSVPCSSPGIDKNWRMKAGECFAIETFATTGKAFVKNNNDMHCNHFMKKHKHNKVNFKLNITKKLYSHINNKYSTLPFCTRWLDKKYDRSYNNGLSELVKHGILQSFPPLQDTPGSYSSQLEHTIYLHDFGKEILSYGDDY